MQIDKDSASVRNDSIKLVVFPVANTGLFGPLFLQKNIFCIKMKCILSGAFKVLSTNITI